jgi:hypothetical protein
VDIQREAIREMVSLEVTGMRSEGTHREGRKGTRKIVHRASALSLHQHRFGRQPATRAMICLD